MNRLRIPVASVTDDGVAVDVTVEGAELGGEHAQDMRPGPVTVTGELSRCGGEYLFQGRVSGSFARACDRCLYEMQLPFEAPVTRVFVHGDESRHPLEEYDEGELDDDMIVFDGLEIDLAPIAWEEVVLAYPARLVCEDRPDLSPGCEANDSYQAYLAKKEDEEKNESSGNKGLAGLADLFPDLKPGGPKE